MDPGPTSRESGQLSSLFFPVSFPLPLKKCGECMGNLSVFAAGAYFTGEIFFLKPCKSSEE